VIASRDSVIDYTGSVFDFLVPGLNADTVSGPPDVLTFNYRGGQSRSPVTTFQPYVDDYDGGVRISASDESEDGYTLITAPGELGGSIVRIYRQEFVTGTGKVGSVPGVSERVTFERELMAFEPSFLGGVFVGSSAGPFRRGGPV
jgi:hypothetical protein